MAIAFAGALILALMAGCGSSSSKSRTKSRAGNLRSSVPAHPSAKAAVKKPRGEAILRAIRAGKASGVRPKLAGFDESDVASFIHSVDSDVGDFWQSQFNQSGYSYTSAFELIITQLAPPVNACQQAWTATTSNAEYCILDNTIYLPVNFLSGIADRHGDAAAAAVIAHENGHHVQQLLGLNNGQLQPIQIELQADCFAGLWMASVYQRDQVQPGDIGNALSLLQAIGDTPGSSPTASSAHGGPQQRQAAFEQGFNSGQGADCTIPNLPTSTS